MGEINFATGEARDENGAEIEVPRALLLVGSQVRDDDGWRPPTPEEEAAAKRFADGLVADTRPVYLVVPDPCGEPYTGDMGPKCWGRCGKARGHGGQHRIEAKRDGGRSVWEWGPDGESFEDGAFESVRREVERQAQHERYGWASFGAFAPKADLGLVKLNAVADGPAPSEPERKGEAVVDDRPVTSDYTHGQPEAERRQREAIRAELDRPAGKKGGAR